MSDLNDVSYKLGQIDGKLDLVLEALKAHVKADEVSHATSDKRVTSLEKSRAWTIGASSALAFVISIIGGIFK